MSTVLYDIIKTQARVTDSVIVAFSGGKESIVTLDLCFRYFKTVKPFFMYICPDLSFQEKTLQWYEKKYQTEITRLPHMDVSEFFHYGSFRPPDYSFPIISINDIYRFTQTDIDFMFDGDDRFSQLFETKEGEKMRGDLEAVKAARKESTEKLKERNNINWYVGIVFETQEDRDRFMREISIPSYEQYITEDQVRRISRANTD